MTPEERERLRQLAELDIEPKDGSWRSQVLCLLNEIERLANKLSVAETGFDSEGNGYHGTYQDWVDRAFGAEHRETQLREQLAALEAENQRLKEEPPPLWRHAVNECNEAHQELDKLGVSKAKTVRAREGDFTIQVSTGLVERIREFTLEASSGGSPLMPRLTAAHEALIRQELKQYEELGGVVRLAPWELTALVDEIDALRAEAARFEEAHAQLWADYENVAWTLAHELGVVGHE